MSAEDQERVVPLAAVLAALDRVAAVRPNFAADFILLTDCESASDFIEREFAEAGDES